MATTTTAQPTTAASTTTSAAGELPHVVLHWLEKSRAQRIVWLLEECKGVTYEIKTYKRGQDVLAPAELKEVHPLGKSPVITISATPSSEKIVLAESGSITEYLSGYFAPQLVPTRYKAGQEGKVAGETETFLRYYQLMQYAEGSFMSILMGGVLVDGIRKAPVPFFVKPITRMVADGIDKAFLLRNYDYHFSFLNHLLETSPNGGEYLCGKDLTAADILLSYPVVAASVRIGYDKYPKLKAYAQKIQNEPGFLASIDKVEKLTGEKYVPVP